MKMTALSAGKRAGKMIRIGAINAGILVALLIILEFGLRWGGVETLFGMEKKFPGWENRIKVICQKAAMQEVTFIDSFRTGSDGLFKANPGHFNGGIDSGSPEIRINEDGFRGNPFQFSDTPRPKILLVGDSFVWGASAQPLTRAFADLIEEAGYLVYNGGIPGTDPDHYASVVEKYAPKLKPDIVAVCIYLGNDVSSAPMPMAPHKNIHYVTNIGFLRGFDDQGSFFKDGPEALRYFRSRKCGCPSCLWEAFLYKTVLGRGLHGLLYGGKKMARPADPLWVTRAMERIRDVCRDQGSEMMIFLIPFVREDVQIKKSVGKNLHLFEGFPCYYPEDLTAGDYCRPPNNHFNNQGHRKFADFILGTLERKGYGGNWKR